MLAVLFQAVYRQVCVNVSHRKQKCVPHDERSTACTTTTFENTTPLKKHDRSNKNIKCFYLIIAIIFCHYSTHAESSSDTITNHQLNRPSNKFRLMCA